MKEKYDELLQNGKNYSKEQLEKIKERYEEVKQQVMNKIKDLQQEKDTMGY